MNPGDGEEGQANTVAIAEIYQPNELTKDEDEDDDEDDYAEKAASTYKRTHDAG